MSAQGDPVTYAPKVGDRVNWHGDGPYTVTAVGKQRALVGRVGGGGEYSARLTDLTPHSDTVTIEIRSEVAAKVTKWWPHDDDGWRGEIGQACRKALGE